MKAIQWVIPESTLNWIGQVPNDRPVAMLVRHSVRECLPPGEMGFELPITEDGRRLAVELGRRLHGRLRTLHASPVRRTMETACCIGEGSGLMAETISDRYLGEPGLFVVDGRAGDSWKTLGHEEVLRRLSSESAVPAGCADPAPAARFLATWMLSEAGNDAGIHAFVTHDSVVALMVARLMGVCLAREEWPMYLEAAFVWQDQELVHVAYQHRKSSFPAPLTGFMEADVVGLARREIAATLGLCCRAHFFLAGGMFKALLTGKPPRDLDIWAATATDRVIVQETLLSRGAECPVSGPYSESYRIGGRIVELSLKVDSPSLEDRLLRFDLALSSVGVEHSPMDLWRSCIHPLAVEAAGERTVRLLPELRNWRHCLASIERMRRYARELGFRIDPADEARLWSIFEGQNEETKLGMIERFRASTRGDQGVAEELAKRMGGATDAGWPPIVRVSRGAENEHPERPGS